MTGQISMPIDIEKHGTPPTLREIANYSKTKGTASALCHVTALEKKKYIERRDGTARGIVIINRPATDAKITEAETAKSVPIVGIVRAGYPTPPLEDIEGYIEIDPHWLRGNNCFLLRVKGDSMIEAHIVEGDLALIRNQATAENRDIVVALINGEATLKEFFLENGQIRLQPRNSSMEPIIIRPGDGDMSVIGKVIGVFRKFR
jgi:repressor LexA